MRHQAGRPVGFWWAAARRRHFVVRNALRTVSARLGLRAVRGVATSIATPTRARSRFVKSNLIWSRGCLM